MTIEKQNKNTFKYWLGPGGKEKQIFSEQIQKQPYSGSFWSQKLNHFGDFWPQNPEA